MKLRFLLSTSLLLLAPTAIRAQNSDLSVLLGVYWPHGEVTTSPATVVSGSAGASLQLNYAWQVIQRAVDLYVELPVIVSVESTSTVSPGLITSSTGPDVYFTPGVRLKISPQSRVSFYGAIGGGVASFAANQVVVARTSSTSTGRASSPALDFGGGIDFRLTRLLSLRFDARDFLTRASLGGSAGRNHGIYEFGIAFHF